MWRRKLFKKHLQSDGDRVWASETRAAMSVWTGWLAALLQLNDNRRYPCSLLITDGRLLLIRLGTEAETGHSAFVLWGGQSQG